MLRKGKIEARLKEMQQRAWQLMKQQVFMNRNWAIRQIEPAERVDAKTEAMRGDWLEAATMPMMVHDILLAHGLVPEEMLVGWCDGAIWVDDFDWLYRCIFSADPQAAGYLTFQGLDTLCDVYLNGELVARHDSFFLSEQVELTGRLQEENCVLLHFHNVKGALAAMEISPEWDANMLKSKLIRKPTHDFPRVERADCDYQGAHPWFTPIGVYRDVVLTLTDGPLFGESDLRADLQEDGSGVVRLATSGPLNDAEQAAALALVMQVTYPDGQVERVQAACQVVDGDWQAELQLQVDAPALWWPRGFGPQNLYRVQMQLVMDGVARDAMDKWVGFKKVENPSSMEFLVNGKRVRLYGGSMDPLQGYTHVWQPERARRMFDMVENANMNMLRIWGQGDPYPDAFYEEADRRGILIWQEFFMGHGSYPDNVAFRQTVVAEARELVLRLRHHACILMWCGGNESIMGAEQDWKKVIGDVILLEDFPKLMAELDPGRYYHPSSPYGGEWANDPREGDYHTYNCVLEYPYEQYPNFLSECIRTAPPVIHSLRRFVRGDLWPAGYTGKFMYEDTFPFPDNWAERTHHGAKGHIKTGPYWEFYDADTPEQLIYRFAAGYGKDLRKEIERCRMGSPDGNVPQSKRTKGYCSCKLLDTWPKIYCAVIDFFQEGFIPYYTTKRALQPLLLCFDKKDSIRLWLVNDSAEDFKGSIKFGLYHLTGEQYTVEKTFPVEMGQGESGIVFDLAELRFFRKDSALTAILYDEAGNEVTTCIDYVTEERRLKFPDADLTVLPRDGKLYVTSSTFAHCVEVYGDSNGDPFGWLFSDNYFDLLPGVTKVIEVVDGPAKGFVGMKPHYSQKPAVKIGVVRP